MQLQESGEMYLETIYVLQKNNKDVRSIDIANELGYSKPSVSRAIHLLDNDNYIDIDPKGYISFTKKGLEIAKKIYERHEILSTLFIKMGVDEKTATDDACRIEHVISNQTMDKIKELLDSNKL